MIRDTFFSAPRFVNLCRKEMVESWKANLLRFVMMYGIMAIAFVWNGYFQYNHLQANGRVSQDPIWNFELGAFVWALVIMGLLSASFIMERMKTKTSRIAMLMIPATMFEKFFSRWRHFVNLTARHRGKFCVFSCQDAHSLVKWKKATFRKNRFWRRS